MPNDNADKTEPKQLNKIRLRVLNNTIYYRQTVYIFHNML